MPDTIDQRVTPGLASIGITKSHSEQAGEVVSEATKATYEFGSMGVRGSWWQNYGNMTAMMVLAIGASFAFMWLRMDSKDSRDEYRQQVIRQEQLAAEQRREDRDDARRREATFERALDVISKASSESTVQMRIATENIKTATESMQRIEKAISEKRQGSIP